MALDPTLLPHVGAFLFVFAIVLGLLSTAKVFDRKNVNVAIAAVFGLFSAMYQPFVEGAQVFLPISAAVLIVVFFFVLLKKLFGEKKQGQHFDALPLAVVLISLVAVLASQWERLRLFVPAEIDPANFAWGLGLILVLVVFWAAYKHEPKSQ